MLRHRKTHMQREADAAHVFVPEVVPHPIAGSVRLAGWCSCLRAVDSWYSEQVGAEVCGKCGGVIRDDVAREAK